MGPRKSGAACLCLTVACLWGCGSSATIELKGHHFVEGEIIAGDSDAIYLDTGQSEVVLPRRKIIDVDHPGNGAATAGIVLAAYGALSIAVGYPKCGEQGTAFCLGVFTPEVLGLALTGYGFAVWTASRNVMNRDLHGRPLARTLLSPTVLRDGGSKAPGLLLVSTY